MKRPLQVIVVILLSIFLGFSFIDLTTVTPPTCSPSRRVGTDMQLIAYDASSENLKKQSKNDKFIKQVFRHLKSISKSIQKTALHAKTHENLQKNRHIWFIPFDDTRTCRNVKNFYVSASDVETKHQKYIVSQGPLNHTVSDFWKMLLLEKSSCIVALAMDIEEGLKKCAPYWKQEMLPLTVDEWTIFPQQETVLRTSKKTADQQIVERLFIAENKKSKETRTISQIHYENWPDNGVPDVALFSELLAIIDEKTKEAPTPICVHCSAGIGRSGTFVAAHSIRKEIRNAAENTPVRINIPKSIFLMRKQRQWLVGTWEQMQVVYSVVADELEARNFARKERGVL
jgi:protein tyrosine phosphatase